MENREKIFVFCYDYGEFLKYKKEFPSEDAEFIVDINTLRGRPPSRVIRYGRYEERWDFTGIEDSCNIMEKVWDKKREEVKDAPNKDLEYGFGE